MDDAVGHFPDDLWELQEVTEEDAPLLLPRERERERWVSMVTTPLEVKGPHLIVQEREIN